MTYLLFYKGKKVKESKNLIDIEEVVGEKMYNFYKYYKKSSFKQHRKEFKELHSNVKTTLKTLMHRPTKDFILVKVD